MSGSERASRPHVAPEVVLQAVIDLSDDAIFICGEDGRIVTWGTTAERLSGFAVADVVGRQLDALCPTHLFDEVSAVAERVLAGERIQHFETEFVRRDGMPIAVWLSLCPLFDADGVAAGAVVIARDVTEQHLAQATLAEVETRLQEGEALGHVGSWLWDLRTGVVQWSTEFHRIHGVDPLDFNGTFESHLGMVHPEDREAVRAAIDESVSSGRPFDLEYRIVRPDRQIRLVRARAQPSVGSAGATVGLRGSGQDVTDDAFSTRDRPGA